MQRWKWGQQLQPLLLQRCFAFTGRRVLCGRVAPCQKSQQKASRRNEFADRAESSPTFCWGQRLTMEPGPVLVCGPAAGGGGDALTGALAGTLAGAVVVTVAGAAGAPTGHTVPEPGGTWTRKSRPTAGGTKSA